MVVLNLVLVEVVRAISRDAAIRCSKVYTGDISRTPHVLDKSCPRSSWIVLYKMQRPADSVRRSFDEVEPIRAHASVRKFSSAQGAFLRTNSLSVSPALSNTLLAP